MLLKASNNIPFELFHRCMYMRFVLSMMLSLTLTFGYAQVDPTNPGQLNDREIGEIDTSTTKSNSILKVFEGNPGKAAFRGLLIPAGGQIYNRRWWKVPLALGVEGATIYNLVYSYQRFSFWDDEYRIVALEGGEPSTIITDGDLILRRRNSWRSKREMAWVYFAVGHVFTAFEAYIDRHLLEFDVSDDLTFDVIPSELGPVPSFTFAISLN